MFSPMVSRKIEKINPNETYRCVFRCSDRGCIQVAEQDTKQKIG